MAGWLAGGRAKARSWPRLSTQGPSYPQSKVILGRFRQLLAINAHKVAPSTGLGCPHRGPSVAYMRHIRSTAESVIGSRPRERLQLLVCRTNRRLSAAHAERCASDGMSAVGGVPRNVVRIGRAWAASRNTGKVLPLGCTTPSTRLLVQKFRVAGPSSVYATCCAGLRALVV